jgi:hypothetical protein
VLSFAVVCEAPADRRTGCDLADRVFLAEVAWLEEELLDPCREWRGLNPGEPCLFWKHVPALARSRNIKAHSHFEGEPGVADAHAARRALLLLHGAENRPNTVVLLRDDDRQAERRRGLDQARRSCKIGIPIAIGLAHPKRECWVLAGFEPQGDQEGRRLTELTGQLGFDPRTSAERLTATGSGEIRSAKRVLDELTVGVWDRQADCWASTDLRILVTRGRSTGLADYLDEVRDRLAPLFRKRPRSD